MALPGVSLLAVAVLVTHPAAAEVYKCTVDGRLIYSDRPCATGETRRVQVAPGPAVADTKAGQLQNEAGMGRVAVGQTATQVEQAWGKPASVNSSVRDSGRFDQWVYRRGDVDDYVYLSNGIVTSISTHTRTNAAPPPIAAPRLQTTAEREEIERQAKAGERKFITTATRMSTGGVVAKLGEPNAKSFSGSSETWTYLPADLDPQTRTVLTFVGGWLTNIDRRPHR